MMTLIFLAVLVPSMISLLGTEAVRQYAIRTSMVDVPNHRSSHTVATPRGGGIAIVVGIVSMLSILTWQLPDQRGTAIGILGGGLLVAAIGLLDDRFGLSAKIRLCIQILAALWLLTWTGGVGQLELFGYDLRLVALPVAVLFIVWSTNVFNFMDGLDGFAGGQAVVAATAAAFLCLRSGDSLLAFTMLATGGAAAGFLVWNWPPAKICMGDWGSGFLGFLFAATAIAAHKHGTISLSSGVLLLLIFLVDATLTLIKRMALGEEWYKPHRSHAYQLATQLGASHKQVTVVSIALFASAAALAVFAVDPSRTSVLLTLIYAGAIVCAWMAINCLFIGRTQALASISSLDEVRHTEQPIAPEAATVVYLRFTRFQSQLRSWRSVMPQNDLLAEATGVASRLGYTVSHDWLDGCGGGKLEAAGEKWILLDFNMTTRDQIRQILLTIQDETTGLDTLSSDMQAALLQARSESQLSNKAA